MAPKPEHSNETSTKSETWQLLMNLDENNGAIHFYLKIYILGSIYAPWEFRDQKWRQNQWSRLLTPKCKFSSKNELHHYSDQDS